MSKNLFNSIQRGVSSAFRNVADFVAAPFRKSNGNLDQRLVQSLRGSRIPNPTQLKYIKTYLNSAERRTLSISLFIFVVAFVALGYRLYTKHLEIVPAVGGEYVEAEIGTPKYINPLYSTLNDIDSDIAQLIYSSLYKHDESGRLAYDLLEGATVSPDGKIYTFKIKSNAKWHNGSPLTANDVLFTFNAIKDPQYKSPLRLSFNGVEAEVIDDQTIIFKLKEPYNGFPELLTFGIMPADLWGQLAPNAVSLAELNLKPIGSGPYKFKSLLKDKNGNLKSISLVANTDYFNGRPLISDFRFQFFPSEEEARAALNDGSIDGLGSYAQVDNSSDAKSFLGYKELATPQVKALFFNTKQDFLGDARVRQAIAMSLEKQKIINETVDDSGRLLEGPILPQSEYYSDNFKRYNLDREGAQKLLEEAGWKLVDVTAEDMAKIPELSKSSDPKQKKAAESYSVLGQGKWYFKDGNYLIIKLTAADIGNNRVLAEAIQNAAMASKIKFVVELIPANQIQTDVIKTRDYEALLTGEILSADPDPYLYWHSSQIGAEGLNLANFSDKEADKLIEDGRLTADPTKRKIDYERFSKLIAEDVPAIYLYQSNYEYIQNHRVKNSNTSVVYAASDRLTSVKDWYIKTGSRFKW